jgi:hypothetical protein
VIVVAVIVVVVIDAVRVPDDPQGGIGFPVAPVRPELLVVTAGEVLGGSLGNQTDPMISVHCGRRAVGPSRCRR